jgi:hypothetical protein
VNQTRSCPDDIGKACGSSASVARSAPDFSLSLFRSSSVLAIRQICGNDAKAAEPAKDVLPHPAVHLAMRVSVTLRSDIV